MDDFLVRPPHHLNLIEGKVYQWQHEARARYAMVAWCVARGRSADAIRWQVAAARAYELAITLLVGDP